MSERKGNERSEIKKKVEKMKEKMMEERKRRKMKGGRVMER